MTNKDEMIPCSKEKEIGKMEAQLEILMPIFLQLKDAVTSLVSSMDSLNKNNEKVSTAISGLLRFQDETTGEIKATQKIKTNQRWLIGFAVASSLTIGGLLIDIFAR